jgi:organic hydroperoxide reductase OsmC/OhrA
MAEKSFEIVLTGEEGYRFAAELDGDLPPLGVDEPEPLGGGTGPSASRLLAVAVGHCLSASLLFCLGKARIEPSAFGTRVRVDIERNDRGRLRIGRIDVKLRPDVTAEDRARMDRCLELFEDFCIVTESVRGGIEVEVEVEPNVT